MAFPSFTMRQLLEAGVHFGHSTRRWNPKMAPYLFGDRNGIHIIDLQQTVPMLHQALTAVRDVVASNGRILFVGTKRAASPRIAEAAKKCGQYYVNHRWLGGMLTNWQTISKSIARLRQLDELLAGNEVQGLTKRETLGLEREQEKLERALGGIKEMGGLPDILFIIDTNKEDIAVAEANKLGIPVVGVIDSNSNPAGITYPVPGNDDAIRAVSLYCDLVADAVLDGLSASLQASGVDIGADENASEVVAAAEEVKSETPPTPEEAAAEVTEALQPAPAEEAAAEAAAEVAAAEAPAEEAKPEETPAEPAEEGTDADKQEPAAS